MRKILIGVLIVILIAGIGLTIANGINLGNIQISSIKQLGEKDKEIEKDIQNLKQMKEVTLSKTMDEIEESAKELKSKREEYALLINDNEAGEINALITAEKYQVEYLWVKLGNYATKNGITLKLNILNSTTGLEGVYNLEFTLNGKYAGITEFIYEIENDETLGFRIYNFKLVPTIDINTESKQNNNENGTNTEMLTATFTVKEVSIDIPKQQLTKNEETIKNSNTNSEKNTTDDTTNSVTNEITNNTVQ